jgi:hypothetical protein
LVKAFRLSRCLRQILRKLRRRKKFFATLESSFAKTFLFDERFFLSSCDIRLEQEILATNEMK